MKNFVIALGIFLVSAAVLGCGQQKAPTYQPAPVSTAKPAETVAVTSPSAPSAAAPKIDVAVQPAPVAPAPAVAAPAATGKEMVIADFNTGDKPNNVGGDFGSWDKDPNDPSQGTKMSFNPDEKYGKDGFSLQLDYDVDSPNPAYNGFWMKLNNLDASKYKNLVLYVKGDPEKGFTPQFKIEIKNKSETGSYIVTGVTDSWQKISVPLKKVSGLSDLTSLTELVIVFDDVNCTEKVGAVNVDDIYFEK